MIVQTDTPANVSNTLRQIQTQELETPSNITEVQALVDEYFQTDSNYWNTGEERRKGILLQLNATLDSNLSNEGLKAIRVREFLNSELLEGWEDALMPMDIIEDDLMSGLQMAEKQRKTLEFYERLFNELSIDTIEGLKGEKFTDLTQYARNLKLEFISAVKTGNFDRITSNSDDIAKMKTALTDLASKRDFDALNEALSLVQNLFSQVDGNILTLNQELVDGLTSELKGLNKLAKDNQLDSEGQKRRQVLLNATKVAAPYIEIYFKNIANKLDSKKLDTLREATQFMMSYIDGDLTKPREQIVTVLIGDTGAGKGTYLGDVDLVAFGAGTDGVSGRGKLHEHFELVLRSFDLAREAGVRMVPHMRVFAEAGILGYRIYLNNNGMEDKGMVLDGYPRNAEQAELMKGINVNRVRAVDYRISPETAYTRTASRIVQSVLKGKQIRPDDVAAFKQQNENQFAAVDPLITNRIVNELINDLSETEKQLDEVKKQDLLASRLAKRLQEINVILDPKGRYMSYRNDFNTQTIPALTNTGVAVTVINGDNLTRVEALEVLSRAVGTNVLPDSVEDKRNRFDRRRIETIQKIEPNGTSPFQVESLIEYFPSRAGDNIPNPGSVLITNEFNNILVFDGSDKRYVSKVVGVANIDGKVYPLLYVDGVGLINLYDFKNRFQLSTFRTIKSDNVESYMQQEAKFANVVGRIEPRRKAA